VRSKESRGYITQTARNGLSLGGGSPGESISRGPFISKGAPRSSSIRMDSASLGGKRSTVFLKAAAGNGPNSDDRAGSPGSCSVHRCRAGSRSGRLDGPHRRKPTSRARAAHGPGGARSATHVLQTRWRPFFASRIRGVIGAVLTSPDVNAELIADGVARRRKPLMKLAPPRQGEAAHVNPGERWPLPRNRLWPDGKVHAGWIGK